MWNHVIGGLLSDFFHLAWFHSFIHVLAWTCTSFLFMDKIMFYYMDIPLFFFIPNWGHFFTAFRERKREISMWDRRRSAAFHMCLAQGSNPQPKHVPWPGIKPATLWLQEDTPRHMDQGWIYHILFTHSSADGYLNCFQSWDITNNKHLYTSFCVDMFSILLVCT